eukprot:1157779-Pelagomonas_calceolata.AAC.3
MAQEIVQAPIHSLVGIGKSARPHDNNYRCAPPRVVATAPSHLRAAMRCCRIPKRALSAKRAMRLTRPRRVKAKRCTQVPGVEFQESEHEPQPEVQRHTHTYTHTHSASHVPQQAAQGVAAPVFPPYSEAQPHPNFQSSAATLPDLHALRVCLPAA